MMEELAALCTATLNKYPTTLEEDEEKLKSDNLPSKEKHCLTIRGGEKQTLNYMINVSETVLPMLQPDSTIKEARKLMNNVFDEEINTYFAESIYPLLDMREKGMDL